MDMGTFMLATGRNSWKRPHNLLELAFVTVSTQGTPWSKVLSGLQDMRESAPCHALSQVL